MYRIDEFDCEERKSDPKRQQYAKAWCRSWVEKIGAVLLLVLVGLLWHTQVQPMLLESYDAIGKWIEPERRAAVKEREAQERENEKKKARKRRNEDLVNFDGL